MKTRTQWLFCMLFSAAVSASAATKGDPTTAAVTELLKLLVFGGLFVWLIWRGFVFLSLLLKPVRDKVRPIVAPINAHAHNTLHRSGLGRFADFGKKLNAGLDGAVAATQKGVNERNMK